LKISLIRPADGEEVSIHTDEVRKWLAEKAEFEDDVTSLDPRNIVYTGKNFSAAGTVSFAWETEDLPKEGDMFFEYSENEDLTGAKIIKCSENRAFLTNLYKSKKYFWRVRAEKDGKTVCTSDTFSFVTDSILPRMMTVDGIINVRDIGGLKADGGMIKQGMLYRGSEMNAHIIITDSGIDTMINDMKIKTELDLRNPANEGVDGKPVGKSPLSNAAAYKVIISQAYSDFLKDEERERCKEIFELLADRDNYPLYIHCWGGADRTGTIVFLLLSILGAEEGKVYDDYEFTSLSGTLRSKNSAYFREFVSGLDKYGKETDSLQNKCIGFVKSCGITDGTLERIREILVERE